MLGYPLYTNLYQQRLQQGHWRADRSLPLPPALAGQTLGLVGLGEIGGRVARAMDAVRAQLVRRDAQVVLLLTPPFDRMIERSPLKPMPPRLDFRLFT